MNKNTDPQLPDPMASHPIVSKHPLFADGASGISVEWLLDPVGRQCSCWAIIGDTGHYYFHSAEYFASALNGRVHVHPESPDIDFQHIRPCAPSLVWMELSRLERLGLWDLVSGPQPTDNHGILGVAAYHIIAKDHRRQLNLDVTITFNGNPTSVRSKTLLRELDRHYCRDFRSTIGILSFFASMQSRLRSLFRF